MKTPHWSDINRSLGAKIVLHELVSDAQACRTPLPYLLFSQVGVYRRYICCTSECNSTTITTDFLSRGVTYFILIYLCLITGCGLQEHCRCLRITGLVTCKMLQNPHGIWNEISRAGANLHVPTDCTR